MLYKDFRTLPYGSLCVLSIVKRTVIYPPTIAKDIERRPQFMVVALTRRSNVTVTSVKRCNICFGLRQPLIRRPGCNLERRLLYGWRRWLGKALDLHIAVLGLPFVILLHEDSAHLGFRDNGDQRLLGGLSGFREGREITAPPELGASD